MWKDLVKEVLPYVSSPDKDFKRAPDGLIISELRKAYILLFREARLGRQTIMADLQCGAGYAPFMPPEGLDSTSIIRVTINGARVFFDYDDGEIFFDPSYADHDQDNGIKITYELSPKYLEDCEMPDSLESNYHHKMIVVNKAIAELLSMPSMDWYNPRESFRRSQLHDEYIIKLMRDTMKSNKRKIGRRASEWFFD